MSDALTGYLLSIKTYTLRLADNVDAHADKLAAQIRNHLSTSPYLPTIARPSPPSPPPPPLPPLTTSWFSVNKLALTITTSFLATGALTYFLLHAARPRSRRRAERAANKARKQVIILSGSPHNPLLRSLALDLDRRGFIVFITTTSPLDTEAVTTLARPDIKPLHLDASDDGDSGAEAFARYLQSPIRAFPGATEHFLQLVGVVVVTDGGFPVAPAETLKAADWSDVLNVRLLWPVVTVRALLKLVREQKARIVLCVPNVVRAVGLPFHTPEAVATAGLGAFVMGLRREVETLGVGVTEIRMGGFETPAAAAQGVAGRAASARAEVVGWTPGVRGAYAKRYNAAAAATVRSSKGTGMRALHVAVFDALMKEKVRRVVRVGSGSLVYDVLGKWMPPGLVGWVLRRKQSWREGADAPPGHVALVESASGSAGTSATGSEGSVEWERV